MRQEKKLLLGEVEEAIDSHGSFVVIRYTSFTANKIASFRREIRENHKGNVKVIKKRVLKKVSNEGVQFDGCNFAGHIGVVLCGHDPLEMTKFVTEFGKTSENAVEVVGGRIDGQMYNAKEMAQLAALPSKKELQSQVVGILNSLLASVPNAINNHLGSIVCCLQNKLEKDQA